MSDVITAHSHSHNVLSLQSISAGSSQNTMLSHTQNNGNEVLPLLPAGFSYPRHPEDDFLFYSLSIQEILHNDLQHCALKNCLAEKGMCCSSWASPEINFYNVVNLLASTAYHIPHVPVAMTNSSIYRGNHPFLSEKAGWRFRDVPTEVCLMCASPWLLHFMYTPSK